MTSKKFFDEMHGAGTTVREAYEAVSQWLAGLSRREISAKRKEAEVLFRRMGITFLVYGAGESTERLIPFDIIPRVLTHDEWSIIEQG